MTARTPFCRCLSQRRLESDDCISATFLGQQAFRFCGGEAGRASRSYVAEERTGFRPRRSWLSVLAGRRSASSDNTRSAAVSPLKSRPGPAGPGFARGCWPAMVGADGGDAGGARHRRWCCLKSGRPHPSSLLSAALAVCGTGGFPRVRLSPCRSAPKTLASCPGGGGAGTAAIQVAGAHLQLRGTRLGGGRFGFGSFLPEEVSLPALKLAVETRLPWDSEDPPASASRAARLKAGVATRQPVCLF